MDLRFLPFFLCVVIVLYIHSIHCECPQNLIEMFRIESRDWNRFNTATNRFPEAFDQLKAMCDRAKLIVSNVGSVTSRCFEGIDRNSLRMAMFFVRRTLRRFCPKRPNRIVSSLLSSSKCLNAVKGSFISCLPTPFAFDSSTTFDVIGLMDKKTVCCFISETRKCFEGKIKNTPECSREDLKFLQSNFDSLLGPQIISICDGNRFQCSNQFSLMDRDQNQVFNFSTSVEKILDTMKALHSSSMLQFFG
ncbi:hypothetical protein SSS_01860 [Sarcoptes scabiei]|uniref:DUF19 domain-containing protein n=1 Tax=Sarcoptes scabiei TaxID=52283 RepID=A0A834RGX5_SARSC|nr:hypothetical protein SSS_01860 [Sarcoptes scabiei]